MTGGGSMWWEPTTESESRLKALMGRVDEQFRTQGQQINGVHAVGTTIGRERERIPLIYLDATFLPDRYKRRRIDSLFQARPRGMLSIVRRLSDFGGIPRCSLEEVDKDIQTLFRRWELPAETEIFFTDPPRPLFETSAKIWAGTKSGTIGMFLDMGDRIVATTAGHLVDSTPSNIYQKRHGFLTTSEERFGSIQFYNDPKDHPGVDIAIIELAQPIAFPTPPNSEMPELRMFIPAAAGPQYAETGATLRGAESGIRQGWINGDALLATRTLDGRTWTNCWNVNEVDGGYAQEGDSGGIVIAENGLLLGHLVGAVGTRKARGRQCGLVQDIVTTLDFIATATKTVPIRPFVAEWPNKNWPYFLRKYFSI